MFWGEARSGSGHRRHRNCLGRLLLRIRTIGRGGMLFVAMRVDMKSLIVYVVVIVILAV